MSTPGYQLQLSYCNLSALKIRELLKRSKELSTPSVILFDIDGTLLASGGAGKVALEEALLAEFGLNGIRIHVPYSGRTDVAIGRDLLKAHDIEPTDARLSQLQESYLRRLPEALNRLQGKILPGVVKLLDALKAGHQPVLIGLLTGNIRRGATVKLGHFGIDHYFSFGGFGDGLLDRDEVARAAWTEAQLQHHGELAIERTWVLGDTPLDISCARAIGAKVLAVSTGHHSMDELAIHSPDLLLPSLEHDDLLAKLVG